MRYIYRPALICLFALSSCLNELKVDPATPSTFVRYINGGNVDKARTLLKVSDGYVILANTEIGTGEGTRSKIKLVKTDLYGAVEWSELHPAFPAEGPDETTVSYRGNGILQDGSGYIITGEHIQNGRSRLLVLKTNDKGLEPDTSTLLPPSAGGLDVSGLAVSKAQNGNFVILGGIVGSSVNNMILAEIDPSTLSLTWDNAYGSGATTLSNRLFIENDPVDPQDYKAVWGGTITRPDSRTDIRLVKARKNFQNTDFDLPIGEPDFDEQGNDICRNGSGYAVIGTTNQKAGGTDVDIAFKRLSSDGTVLTSTSFPVFYQPGDPATDTQQDEEGNGISKTSDGGFILLGTILSSTSPSGETIGRGEKDYYIIKISAFGNVEWTKVYGSKRDDVGVSVVQADDGGYVILGTTRLANVETITLIKTDRDGNID